MKKPLKNTRKQINNLLLFCNLCYNYIGDSMQVNISNYNDTDYKQVFNIFKEAFNYEKELVENPNVFEFVAKINDIVVGYFNLHEEIDVVRNIKIHHLGYVCVRKEYRSQGIGRKMVEYAINFSKENNASRIELTSCNNREVAHKLYLSLGFEKRDSVIFRKEL